MTENNLKKGIATLTDSAKIKELTVVLPTGLVHFNGFYRRDLEKPTGHYYETANGDIIHVKKDAMMAVIENWEDNDVEWEDN